MGAHTSRWVCLSFPTFKGIGARRSREYCKSIFSNHRSRRWKMPGGRESWEGEVLRNQPKHPLHRQWLEMTKRRTKDFVTHDYAWAKAPKSNECEKLTAQARRGSVRPQFTPSRFVRWLNSCGERRSLPSSRHRRPLEAVVCEKRAKSQPD